MWHVEQSTQQQKLGKRLMWVGGALLGSLALLFGIGAVYQAIVSRREKSRFPPPGRLVDVGGHRLH